MTSATKVFCAPVAMTIANSGARKEERGQTGTL